jgi:hypothetical protein
VSIPMQVLTGRELVRGPAEQARPAAG